MSGICYRVRTDGASRGNPGPASIGISIEDESGDEVVCAAETIGVTTNNVAEYTALIRALELLADLRAEQAVFYLDSQLIVRQLNGEYRVKDPKMKQLYAEVRRKLSRLANATFEHVRREDNLRADALANQALDDAL